MLRVCAPGSTHTRLTGVSGTPGDGDFRFPGELLGGGGVVSFLTCSGVPSLPPSWGAFGSSSSVAVASAGLLGAGSETTGVGEALRFFVGSGFDVLADSP